MATICLLLGVALGYLFRGFETRSTVPSPADTQPMPTLEQMKQMGDKQAKPLLAKLKTDPRNASLLIQVGHVYESVHQFKEAASYYEQSLAIDPKNVAIRNEMASCLYYNGDVDAALSELQRSLKDDPNNANSLFNVGLIRWKNKKDASGAVAAWQQLLKANPQLQKDKRAEVEKLIAQTQQNGATN
jgi:cytochrome c-type biogenesis protein CcmH/NrfG